MKAFLASAAAALALVLTGCTTNGEVAQEPPLPGSTESIVDSGLQLKLLSEADLPAGYTETELPNVKGGLGAMVGCPALDVKPSVITGEATASFAGAGGGSFIAETVRLATPTDSKQALADLAAMPQQCPNVKAAKLSALGTESTAIQLTAKPPSLGVTLDGYVVGVRDDKMVVLVVFVSPGKADLATVEAVAKTAWEKALL